VCPFKTSIFGFNDLPYTKTNYTYITKRKTCYRSDVNVKQLIELIKSKDFLVIFFINFIFIFLAMTLKSF
jgi:hypothetical protein